MNFRLKTSLPWITLALLGLATSVPAHAQVGLFNFDAETPGTQTTFSETSGGITATFSSPSAPGVFVIAPSSLFPGSVLLSGSILADGLPNGVNAPLDIAFSRNLASLTLDFSDASFFSTTAQTFTLQAFENGTSVGSVTVPGLTPAGAFNSEGVIGFFGPAFNSVELSSATSNSGVFAIDNVGVVAAPAVPEASTTVSFGLLLALGLGGVIVAKKRRTA